jgi:hypothetical protein
MAEASNLTARSNAHLLVLFGALYFVQGVVEPTACADRRLAFFCREGDFVEERSSNSGASGSRDHT